LLIGLLTGLAGCSSSDDNSDKKQEALELPYFGMFLKEQGVLTELVEGRGGPPAQGVPATTSSQR